MQWKTLSLRQAAISKLTSHQHQSANKLPAKQWKHYENVGEWSHTSHGMKQGQAPADSSPSGRDRSTCSRDEAAVTDSGERTHRGIHHCLAYSSTSTEWHQAHLSSFITHKPTTLCNHNRKLHSNTKKWNKLRKVIWKQAALQGVDISEGMNLMCVQPSASVAGQSESLSTANPNRKKGANRNAAHQSVKIPM